MPQQWPKLDLARERPKTQFWDPPTTDPLAVWPDEYESAPCNRAWAALHNWRSARGFGTGTVEDVGYEIYTLNYAFARLGHLIPTRASDHQLYFDEATPKDIQAKRDNFYSAFLFIKVYPKYRRMKKSIGISGATFTRVVRSTIYILASHIEFLDWMLRFWHYNHTEHFDRVVTISVDCFPVRCCGSSNRFIRRLCKSGKYKEYVLKGELVVMVGSGLPVDYTGMHIGVRHDGRCVPCLSHTPLTARTCVCTPRMCVLTRAHPLTHAHPLTSARLLTCGCVLMLTCGLLTHGPLTVRLPAHCPLTAHARLCAHRSHVPPLMCAHPPRSYKHPLSSGCGKRTRSAVSRWIHRSMASETRHTLAALS